MLPVAVPVSAHAAARTTGPTALAAPVVTAAPSTATASRADCVRVDPADTRSPDRLRGEDSRRSGRAAVTALGSRLGEAAALNHRSTASLTSILERDRTARLDGCSQLLFVDTALPAGTVAAADPVTDPAPGTVSLSEALSLNSRPGSARTIYLDFLGGTYNGSFVCQYAAATPCNLPAFTQDADATTFSATELVAIYRIWQSVAEDYAPFDVNVSTQDLGSAALDRASSGDLTFGTRVVVTSDARWAAAQTATPAGCGCGGMAYVGVWCSTSSSYAPYEKPTAVIVTANLGGGGTKYVAEATSHEVGHNFGLLHDGTIAHGTTAAVGYYAGQGVWAPIMGVGYNKPVTQWSKGEYPYANNTQDDTAIIATGAPLLADDAGSTPGTATALTSGTPVPGLITSPTDSDWFSFTSFGLTQLAVTPAATNPNLDVSLEVYAADGTTLVEAFDPAVSGSQNSGLSTSVAGLEAHRTSTPLASGTYFAKVTGSGEGDPAVTGYSSYASLGRYTISTTTSSPGPLAVASSTPAPVITGTPYSWTASTTGGVGNAVTWAVTSGTLPTGLSLASSGKVSGTATTPGSRTVTLTATEATTLTTASASVTFDVYAPVSVTSTTLPLGVVGSAYSRQLTSSGGASIQWSVASGSTAPAGLTLAADGTLSGTPTTATAYSFSAKAYDPVSTSSALMAVSLTVAAALAVSTAGLPDATTGTAVSSTITAAGGTGTSTWSITAGSLPPGLSLTPGGATTVTVTGTPTTTGTYPFTIKATNAATVASAGGTASKALSIRVADPLVVTSVVTPVGVPGVAYTTTLGATGGVGSVTFALNSGAVLPDGLVLSSAGVVSGTPTAAGDYSLAVKATDSRGVTATDAIPLSIVPQLVISELDGGPTEVGFGSASQVWATGGTASGPIQWSVTSGTLPPGITLGGASTAMPTFDGLATTDGSWTFTLAVDNTGSVPHAEKEVTIVVAKTVAAATCAPSTAMVGIPFSSPVAFTGGVAPFTFLVTSSPAVGLGVDSAGHLSGTATAAGSGTVDVTVTDGLGVTTTASCPLTVVPRLLVTTTAVGQPTLGKAYAAWLSAVGGGTSPRTWTAISGTLPTGVTLSTAGRLSGTPTRTGTYAVTVRVTTADGFAAAKKLTIIVAAKLAITTRPVLAVAHRYKTYSARLVATGGYGTRTWTKASGSLPSGLKLSSTGVVSGRATRLGTYVMTVRVRDRAGRVTTKRITIVVRV